MIRDIIIAIFTVLFFVVILAFWNPATAHSWYPNECCNDDDCTPATIVSKNSKGFTLRSKFGDHFIEYGSKLIRPSQDNYNHICVISDVGSEVEGQPICVFIPVGS